MAAKEERMSALKQVNLDFSEPKFIDEEKKTEMISFRSGEKFKTDLLVISRAKNIDLSVLIHEYVIKGYLEDYKNLLLLQANGNKTVKDLLR
jgi:hypothetical protein